MEITQELVNTCNSFADLTRRLGKNPHNRITHKLRDELIKNEIKFDHFTKNGVIPKQFQEKICPICKLPFTPKYSQDQVTCSYSCANTFFSRKDNRQRNKKRNYKRICFEEHGKRCIVCGEDKIVEVHHADENHKNDSIENLIPLCPTHHQYWHSRYRELIRDKIETFLTNSKF